MGCEICHDRVRGWEPPSTRAHARDPNEGRHQETDPDDDQPLDDGIPPLAHDPSREG
jgi:hypothetical protein